MTPDEPTTNEPTPNDDPTTNDDPTPPATGEPRNADASSDLAERAERLRARDLEGRTLTRDEYHTTSRRAFLGGALGVAAGVAGFRFVQTQESVDGIPAVLRRGHEFNADLWRTIAPAGASAPEYPVEEAVDLRRNGRAGIREEIDLDAWSMRVEGPDGELLDEVVLDDVLSMPEVEMVTLHKCIEGWSQVAHWTGVRFADFAERYASRIGEAEYVALETPDEGYYVGLTREDSLHPQTLLAHGLGGEPLTQDHGAPLRLYTPNHYGIKSLKRIGLIRFTRERPRDFWAERSYDWNSHL